MVSGLKDQTFGFGFTQKGHRTREIWILEDDATELPETRKLPEKTTKLQKFTQDGSGSEKFPNLAQMFLRSRRCSSKNLAQKGIRVKEKKILEGG